MIPHTFWVNHGNGALSANSEAVRLTAEDFTSRLDVQFTEAALEIVPRNDALAFTAALVFCLIRAEENVSFYLMGHTQAMGQFFGLLIDHLAHLVQHNSG